jgi:hypothetical protein
MQRGRAPLNARIAFAAGSGAKSPTDLMEA